MPEIHILHDRDVRVVCANRPHNRRLLRVAIGVLLCSILLMMKVPRLRTPDQDTPYTLEYAALSERRENAEDVPARWDFFGGFHDEHDALEVFE